MCLVGMRRDIYLFQMYQLEYIHYTMYFLNPSLSPVCCRRREQFTSEDRSVEKSRLRRGKGEGDLSETELARTDPDKRSGTVLSIAVEETC